MANAMTEFKSYYMNTATEQAKQATAWAAGSLTQRGATLYPTETGWDVELADGSWRAANDWRELCAVAREVNTVR